MKSVFIKIILVLIVLCFHETSNGQNQPAQVVYEENKGQWPLQAAFKANLQAGSVFLENNRLLFSSWRMEDIHDVHEQLHDAVSQTEKILAMQKQVQCHTWAVYFEGGQNSIRYEGHNRQEAYSNYFIGNNKSEWASRVGRFEYVTGYGVYPYINIKTYSEAQWFKYDFEVYPGGDAAEIKLRYEGAAIELQKDGSLLIKLSTGEMIEKQPVAWQHVGNSKVPVKCRYTVNGNLLGFDFPDGYDPEYTLIIDPTLVGSTYSGSPAIAFGNCAAPDNQGNLISGAQVFGAGYPVTVGAFSVVFAGLIDMAITKYNSTASALVYSTYIGGSFFDVPFTLLTSPAGDLFIYGASSSTNFPVTSGVYDNTANGQNDFVITQIDASGSIMLASTYVGGSNDDGWGLITDPGDISLTSAGHLVVTGNTLSTNFPVTAGTFQQTSGGGVDAVLFSLSPGLTTLDFSTYLGGSGDETGTDNVIDPVNGDIIVSGYTNSGNFPLQQPLQSNFLGINDGFISRFNSSATALVSSTYYGTSGFDFCAFIETDAAGNIYVYGNATGGSGIPATAGVYSNPNSATFITKFDPLLQTVIYSTQIGTGNILDWAQLTAFMIDECENIHIAGFYGTTPVTANAIYTAANSPGSSYIAVLSKDALTLSHATFFGGNHTESGKCRFDSAGTIYHATCQNSLLIFPVSSSAFSATNNSGGYDVCAFKIAFPPTGVVAQASAIPSNSGCAPFNVSFVNNSNGVNYYWDFGDGSPVNTNTAPVHTYTLPGVYTVTLIAEDSSSCIVRDTTTITLTVLQPPLVALGSDTLFCGNMPAQLLDAGNPGLTYTWSTGATTQIITATTPGLYWVTADNGSCTHTDSVQISLIATPPPMPDSVLCAGQSNTLNAGGGQTWLWNTSATAQSINVTTTGNYSVIITDSLCTFHDTALVVFNTLPVVNLGNDTLLCTPQPLTLDAGNSGSSWLWSTGATTQQITVNNAGSYYVTATALNCSASDTLQFTIAPQPELGPAQSLCTYSQLTLNPANMLPGSAYLWNTGAVTPSITVSEAGIYHVAVTYQYCVLTDSVEVTGTPGEGTLYVPNSFTPNGDGVNDVFRATASEVSEFHVTIFNRWGQLLFESYSINEAWDGRFNNEIVQQDTYAVIVSYRTPCAGNVFERKLTHVNVIR
ncbi:MAG: gliding motility-associated C-terminal domain-containing protein [Bacteroidetes bacterium]|nr:gliding motility-associated C-terminal domain-containing protein [Bacteroidota bacterium]